MPAKRLLLLLALLSGCAPARGSDTPASAVRSGTVTLTFLATSDVHGHVEREGVDLKLADGGSVHTERGGLDLLGGYVKNARLAHPGRVVLLDGGDMLQGTMVSNLGEGHAVVSAMNALGYAAAAVGNHEFDFGPVGPRSTPGGPADDPLGVIKARVAEARYPWLTSNVVDARSGGPMADGIRPFVVIEVDGVKLGIVGGTTTDVPRTTRAANLRDLRVDPLETSIAAAATAARAAGATVVVAVVHEGGECRRLDAPDDLASCRADSTIFQVARALPPGAVDAIFAGHTHQGVAARVAGIPIVQAWAEARAFSRIDLTIDRASGRVVPGGAQIHVPIEVCAAVLDGNSSCEPKHARGAHLVPARYEGALVEPDAAVIEAVREDRDRVAARFAQPVGVLLGAPITRRHRDESALGNLAADAFRTGAHTDVGLTNGGGLRADLPAGQLVEGQLFQAFPFDNRVAILRLRGAALRRLLERNLAGEHGILSISGITAVATCDGSTLHADIRLAGGRPIVDDTVYTVATSDFLAQGGDDFGEMGKPAPDTLRIDEDGPLMRDLVADELRRHGATIDGDRVFYDPAHPRIRLPRARPNPCGVPAKR